MTTLHVADVAAAIAALDIDGVTVYDLDQMPQAVDERACPALGPSASDPSFLTEWEARRLTTQGNWQNVYTLNYSLFQAKVAKGRGLFEQYPAMVAKAAAVVEAFQRITRVDGCKHIAVAGMPAFGPVFDASGQQFHGCTVSLRVHEY